MFSSPFQSDSNMEPNFSFHGQQSQQAPQAQPQQSQPKQGQVLSAQDVNNIIQNLRVTQMTNPVKITEPSYLITESQMKQLLALQQGQAPQPQQPVYTPPQYASPQQFNMQPMPQPIMYNPYVYPVAQPVKEKGFFDKVLEKAKEPQGGNMIDTIGNATFGTVGRIGHTITSVIDGVVDVLTLGYGARRY